LALCGARAASSGACFAFNSTKVRAKAVLNTLSLYNPKFRTGEYLFGEPHTCRINISQTERASAMQHFFFHLSSKDTTIHDDKGRELNDLAAAHWHATMMIHKLLTLDDTDWRGWSIKVSDVTQRSVLSVLFPQNYCRRFASSPRRGGRDSVGK